jgi:hypothetical protein
LGLPAPVASSTAGEWIVTSERGRPEPYGRTAANSDPNPPASVDPSPRQPTSDPAGWIIWVGSETPDELAGAALDPVA